MTATSDLGLPRGDCNITLTPAEIIDVVEIEVQGGPPGGRGPQGVPGPPGDASAVVYFFNDASTTWLVPHNLHRFPVVTVVDGDGAEVWTQVHFDSIDLVRIVFDLPSVGRVFVV